MSLLKKILALKLLLVVVSCSLLENDEYKSIDIESFEGIYAGEYLIPRENRGGPLNLKLEVQDSSHLYTVFVFGDTSDSIDVLLSYKLFEDEIIINHIVREPFLYSFSGSVRRDSVSIEYVTEGAEILFWGIK